MPMPASEPIADLRQRLEQLNQLEDNRALAKKTGRSALNSEALMESLRSNVPFGVLTHHDRLRSRGRQSVAEVRHGVCSGCHMSLPTGLQAEVQRESTLPKCETCGRFIFPAKEAVEPQLPANVSGSRKRAKN
jgi:predicted  nucleic acid-binding Zn-ribbon protein